MNLQTCTLNFDGIPLTYHICFDVGSSAFIFTPGIGNQFAPAFTIIVEHEDYFTNDHVPDTLWHQAMNKVKMILSRGDEVF
jgi:hypothetical protein